MASSSLNELEHVEKDCWLSWSLTLHTCKCSVMTVIPALHLDSEEQEWERNKNERKWKWNESVRMGWVSVSFKKRKKKEKWHMIHARCIFHYFCDTSEVVEMGQCYTVNSVQQKGAKMINDLKWKDKHQWKRDSLVQHHINQTLTMGSRARLGLARWRSARWQMVLLVVSRMYFEALGANLNWAAWVQMRLRALDKLKDYNAVESDFS